MDKHTGGKWLIHETKRRKDNHLQSLKLPCRISKLSGTSWWTIYKFVNVWLMILIIMMLPMVPYKDQIEIYLQQILFTMPCIRYLKNIHIHCNISVSINFLYSGYIYKWCWYMFVVVLHTQTHTSHVETEVCDVSMGCHTLDCWRGICPFNPIMSWSANLHIWSTM